MWQVKGGDELVLEGGLQWGRDMLCPAGQLGCLTAQAAVEQSNAGAISGGIAYRGHPLQVAVGDQPQDHGMEWANEAAESPGQDDAVHALDV
jgi:hypothetical protein